MWSCKRCGHNNEDWDDRCLKCRSEPGGTSEIKVQAPVVEEKSEREPETFKEAVREEPKKKRSEEPKMKCVQCGGKSFTNATVQLANAIDTVLLETQWNSAKSCCLICNDCGFVHFFIKS